MVWGFVGFRFRAQGSLSLNPKPTQPYKTQNPQQHPQHIHRLRLRAVLGFGMLRVSWVAGCWGGYGLGS